MNRRCWFALVTLALSCTGSSGSDDDDDDGASDSDSGATQDSGAGSGGEDSGAGGGFPADPRPLTVTVSGALSQTITFDQVTCTHPLNSSNFRIFWRGTGHVFVLKAEVLGDYNGVGVYSSADTNTRASLQEEAGGSGIFFTADASQGDTVSFEMSFHDTTSAEAWGTFTVSGMHGADGAITLDPVTLPIWCPVVA